MSIRILTRKNVLQLPVLERKDRRIWKRYSNSKGGGNRRVFAYLHKRDVTPQVIRSFSNPGLLYEDAKYHNCVFVGRASDIPKTYCEELNISVLPLTVITEYGKEYRDGVDITPAEFYRIIDTSAKLPVSSQVTAALYARLEEHPNAADQLRIHFDDSVETSTGVETVKSTKTDNSRRTVFIVDGLYQDFLDYHTIQMPLMGVLV